ncbi:hypothetical protein HW450_05210 [Corynebacterium hindlerae]|uniref:Secreted protein n=1 Tax=Corynebacterium hindlerae TaxID=699041 RepID=A0A7G5FHM4_9CORY|nr:hypothetical protein [Corynebacterium hindlerae]QMV86115.1 hypothetical protein HW450_05210 [Corynebacterium hindlerae]
MTRSLAQRIAVLTVATAIPLTSVAVANVAVPSLAVAQTADAMPNKYFSTPADDADQFLGEVKTFQTISMLRHTYHEAARNQKYDSWPASETINEIHWRSEHACFAAKARLALAILKAEGDLTARQLDLAKVGVDLIESEKAVPVLTAATAAAWELSTNAEATDEKREGKHARHMMFNEGLGELNRIVEILKDGGEPTEYDAFSIIDWGVDQKWVDKARETVHPGTDADKLKVYRAGDKLAVDGEALHDSATHNRTVLSARFGIFSGLENTPAPSASIPTSVASTPATATATVTKPAETTATATVTKPAETTATPTVTKPAETTATPTVTKPAETTATPTVTKPAETTTPADSKKVNVTPAGESTEKPSGKKETWFSKLFGPIMALAGFIGVIALFSPVKDAIRNAIHSFLR